MLQFKATYAILQQKDIKLSIKGTPLCYQSIGVATRISPDIGSLGISFCSKMAAESEADKRTILCQPIKGKQKGCNPGVRLRPFCV